MLYPKTRSGRSFYEFAPLETLATDISIAAALNDAVATEDALWHSETSGSPISPIENLTSIPSMLTSEPPPEGAPHTSSLPSRHSQTPASPLPVSCRAVSIEPLPDLSELSDFSDSMVDSMVVGRGIGGSQPGPNSPGKHKRPLTEGDRKRRRERHRKQRATDAAKARKREKRRSVKSDKLPTERKPRFPKDLDPPQPIFSGIRPLSHFPVVSTGYIGDKGVEPILEKHIWTLEELVGKGLEIFEWDGR
jgi:hypothetical protein